MTAAISIRGAPPLALPPGLHPDVPAHRYLARELGVVRKTALQYMAQSPLHYYTWATSTEDEDTPSLSLGRATHMALLEPERFAQEYIMAPDFGPCRKTDDCGSEQAKINKTRRDEFRRVHANHEVLSGAEGAALMGMVSAIQRHPKASRLLSGGLPEVTVAWADKETGLPCRLRADRYRPDLGAVIDIKSCRDASPRAFARDVAKYGYGIQDTHYRAGFGAIGKEVRYFLYIAVESAPPHAVAIYTMRAVDIAITYGRVRELMRTMADCVATGSWPGFSDAIQELELPVWY
jgi:hypothetical protein